MVSWRPQEGEPPSSPKWSPLPYSCDFHPDLSLLCVPKIRKLSLVHELPCHCPINQVTKSFLWSRNWSLQTNVGYSEPLIRCEPIEELWRDFSLSGNIPCIFLSHSSLKSLDFSFMGCLYTYFWPILRESSKPWCGRNVKDPIQWQRLKTITLSVEQKGNTFSGLTKTEFT